MCKDWWFKAEKGDEMQPLISIIVPVYNIEDYLEQCIESIVNQDYENIEVILVDDSTDSSGKICDIYAEKDSRVRVIHGKRRTLTFARKTGLALAKGEYIGFVDGDDWIAKDMYKHLEAYMNQYDVDIVSSGYYKCWNEKKILICDAVKSGIYRYKENYNEIIDILIGSPSGGNKSMIHNLWCKLYKAPIIKEAFRTMNDDVAISEDWLGFTKAVLLSKSVYVVNEAFYYYRVNDSSMVHTRDPHFFKKFNLMYNSFKDEIQKYDEYIDTLSCQLVYRMTAFILEGINNRFDFGFDIDISVLQYMLPVELLGTSKNIILCGAGKVGRNYYRELMKRPEYKLVGWIDNNSKVYVDYQDTIYPLEYVNQAEYDVILLGAMSEGMAESMKMSLTAIGVPEERIVWCEPRDFINIGGLEK